MANWNVIRKDVNDKIDLLEITEKGLKDDLTRDLIVRDLILPAATFLAKFCECVDTGKD